jgi:hypothetical protein
MKFLEKFARYFLAAWFMICAVDGWSYLLFDAHLFGDHKGYLYLSNLVEATYFWAFLKTIQLVGALSLLFNYKPALGLALITPISAVLCLFYIFELQVYIPIAILIIIATLVLGRAYLESFKKLMKDYP